VSTPHLWKIVGELGFRLKKSLHATECETEANRQRREVFVEWLRSIALERLIFLDENAPPPAPSAPPAENGTGEFLSTMDRQTCMMVVVHSIS
jgi:hypothetical protein